MLFQRGLLLLALFSPLAAQSASPEPHPVLFVGSSTMYFWQTLSSDFPGVPTKNLGVGGTEYTFIKEKTPEWSSQFPAASQIVMYSGDNDVSNGGSPEQVAQNFAQAAQALHAKYPLAEIVVIGVKPSNARVEFLDKTLAANDRIEQAARQLGFVHYVDVNTAMLDDKGQPRRELFGGDALHMNPTGYALWKKVLTPALQNCDQSRFFAGQTQEILGEMMRGHAFLPALQGAPVQARSIARGIAAEFESLCGQQQSIANRVRAAGVKAAKAADAQSRSHSAALQALHEAQDQLRTLRLRIHARYPELLQRAKAFGAYDRGLVARVAMNPAAKPYLPKLWREAESGRIQLTYFSRKLLMLDHNLSLQSLDFEQLAREHASRWRRLDGGKAGSAVAAAEALLAKDAAERLRLDREHESLMKR